MDAQNNKKENKKKREKTAQLAAAQKCGRHDSSTTARPVHKFSRLVGEKRYQM